MEIQSHRGSGLVKVALLQFLTPDEANSHVGAGRRQIREAFERASKRTQVFEEGDVLLSISAREQADAQGKPLSNAATYIMDITPVHKLGYAPRMHAHIGLRSLEITTDSHATIQVWSTGEIETDSNDQYHFETQNTVYPGTDIPIYGVIIPPNCRVSVQIPPKTVHQFITLRGRAFIRSEHPEELDEQAEYERLRQAAITTPAEMTDLTFFFDGNLSKRIPIQDDPRIPVMAKDPNDHEALKARLDKTTLTMDDLGDQGKHSAYIIAKMIHKQHKLYFSTHQVHGVMHRLFEKQTPGIERVTLEDGISTLVASTSAIFSIMSELTKTRAAART